jgi:dipeptidyl aminopeptidase/acylaminoacyl peptidase
MTTLDIRNRRLLGLALLGSAMLPFPALAACDPMPAVSQQPRTQRPLTAEDLMGVRDIGSPQRPEDNPVFAASPDGRTLAFLVSRADAATNTVCRALVSLAAKPGASPRVLDIGGEPIFELVATRGLLTDYGYAAVDVPIWSPDGQWLAYLRREHGVTQLWRVKADGTDAQPVTQSAASVETFAWSKDGTALLFGTQAGLVEAMRQREIEGLSGYRYDDRYVPYNEDRPGIRMPIPLAYFAADLATGGIRKALDSEASLARPRPAADSDADYQRSAKGPAGQLAQTRFRDPAQLFKKIDVWARLANGQEVRCMAAECSGSVFNRLTNLWWSADGKTVLILRRTGWGHSENALYRWDPTSNRIAEVFRTPDLLSGCDLIGNRLVCASDSSKMPRRLVEFDVATGRRLTLWDANPEFANLNLGTVQRLHWKNKDGFENFGDLVLPPGYRPGQRLPMIVVQYTTRGFLRGGTGDEYPIWLFAQRGFAVLSVQKSPMFASTLSDAGLSDWASAHALDNQASREDENQLSNIVTGVELAISMGVADRRKLGISGLSAGASTAMYSLIHTSLFSAAAISSMGMDPQSMVYGGPMLAEFREKIGYPSTLSNNQDFWRNISLAANADRLDTPVLLQLSSREYLVGVEAYEALHARKKPVDMYVFPDEGHLKWQPAHKAAIYQRNLDWFDFWLNGQIDPATSKAGQYDIWRQLRVDRDGLLRTPPHGDGPGASALATPEARPRHQPGS